MVSEKDLLVGIFLSLIIGIFVGATLCAASRDNLYEQAKKNGAGHWELNEKDEKFWVWTGAKPLNKVEK
jgi:hypothetical protein